MSLLNIYIYFILFLPYHCLIFIFILFIYLLVFALFLNLTNATTILWSCYRFIFIDGSRNCPNTFASDCKYKIEITLADSQTSDTGTVISETLVVCRRSYLTDLLYTRYLQYPHRNDIKVGAVSEIWGEPTSLSRTASTNLLATCRLDSNLNDFPTPSSRRALTNRSRVVEFLIEVKRKIDFLGKDLSKNSGRKRDEFVAFCIRATRDRF